MKAIWWFHEREIEMESLKLTAIAEHFGLDTGRAHDALDDCRLAAAIARKMSLTEVLA
jgi:DNA polymerase III epsilon subunit-like protein